MRHKISTSAPLKLLAAALAVGSLSGCMSLEYRCPLDPTEKPADPTACTSMHDAMAGAVRGDGGKTSVMLDDKGRLIPKGLKEHQPATAVTAMDPYRPASGSPVFTPPKVFQTWTGATVDANGNLHDGHHAWFATPGQWNYGSVGAAGPASGGLSGDNLMRPTIAGEGIPVPKETQRMVQPRKAVQAAGAASAQAPAPQMTPKQTEQAAMANLAKAAQSVAPAPQRAPAQHTPATGAVVTPPAALLTD